MLLASRPARLLLALVRAGCRAEATLTAAPSNGLMRWTTRAGGALLVSRLARLLLALGCVGCRAKTAGAAAAYIGGVGTRAEVALAAAP